MFKVALLVKGRIVPKLFGGSQHLCHTLSIVFQLTALFLQSHTSHSSCAYGSSNKML